MKDETSTTKTPRKLRLRITAGVVLAIAITVAFLFKTSDPAIKSPSTAAPVRANNPATNASTSMPSTSSNALASGSHKGALVAPDTSKASGRTAMRQLNPAQQLEFQNLYRDARGDRHRLSQLAWGLTTISNQRSVDLLVNTLTNDFEGQVFKNGEDKLFRETACALGILAKENEAAWRFLNNGLNREFWMTNATWKSATEHMFPGRTVNTLVDNSFYGLAISARPEFPELLNDLRRRSPDFLKRYHATMVGAAFTYHLITNSNTDKMQYSLMQTEGDFDEYLKWSSAGIGAEWDAWALEIAGFEANKDAQGRK
jgi:hypothetical protein